MNERVRGPVFTVVEEHSYGLYEVYDSQDEEEVYMEIWTDAQDNTKVEMVFERRGNSWHMVTKSKIPQEARDFIGL